MRAPKIFGREPAFIVGVVEATLAMLISFGALRGIGIDGPEALAVVMAVVSGGLGLYVAYVTKDTLLGATLAFLKASVTLGAFYGYAMTESQMASVVAVVSLLVGAYQRTQTGPAVLPSFDLGQHSVEVPPDGEATKTVPAVAASGAIVEKPADDVGSLGS